MIRVVVWNMAGGYGYQAERHDAAWRYLADLEPDIALVQEAVPPRWAAKHWAGMVAAQKYPGSRIPWGSAVLTREGPLERFVTSSETPCLDFVWGGTVVARSPWLDGRWLISIHSKAESKHPSQYPPHMMAAVRLCHPEKVWEVELAAADLESLLVGQQFIAGGDLNSSLGFDANYGRRTNVTQFANLRAAGFNDLRLPFEAEEQQTYFKRGRRPYQLDHVYGDAATLDAARSWRVIPEPAAELRLSDHAPIELTIDQLEGRRVPDPRSSSIQAWQEPGTSRPGARRKRDPRRSSKREADRGRVACLVEHAVLKEGDELWLRKEAMARKRWHLYDPDHIGFTSIVTRNESGEVLLQWRSSPDAEPELVHPVDMTFRVYQTLQDQMPDWHGRPFLPRRVLTCFTKGRDGPVLSDLASNAGVCP